MQPLRASKKFHTEKDEKNKLIGTGEKVYVITRRTFEGNLRRQFVGVVQAVTDFAMRVQGYAFVFDDVTKQFVRREDLRTRIFSLLDAGLVIHILPEETRLDDVQFIWDENNRRMITDRKNFSMNVSEFSLNR